MRAWHNHRRSQAAPASHTSKNLLPGTRNRTISPAVRMRLASWAQACFTRAQPWTGVRGKPEICQVAFARSRSKQFPGHQSGQAKRAARPLAPMWHTTCLKWPPATTGGPNSRLPGGVPLDGLQIRRTKVSRSTTADCSSLGPNNSSDWRGQHT
jgi:hypothetical protein